MQIVVDQDDSVSMVLIYTLRCFDTIYIYVYSPLLCQSGAKGLCSINVNQDLWT